jgi:hypothetical protein
MKTMDRPAGPNGHQCLVSDELVRQSSTIYTDSMAMCDQKEKGGAHPVQGLSDDGEAGQAATVQINGEAEAATGRRGG